MSEQAERVKVDRINASSFLALDPTSTLAPESAVDYLVVLRTVKNLKAA